MESGRDIAEVELQAVCLIDASWLVVLIKSVHVFMSMYRNDSNFKINYSYSSKLSAIAQHGHTEHHNKQKIISSHAHRYACTKMTFAQV